MTLVACLSVALTSDASSFEQSLIIIRAEALNVRPISAVSLVIISRDTDLVSGTLFTSSSTSSVSVLLVYAFGASYRSITTRCRSILTCISSGAPAKCVSFTDGSDRNTYRTITSTRVACSVSSVLLESSTFALDAVSVRTTTATTVSSSTTYNSSTITCVGLLAINRIRHLSSELCFSVY